jgi:hypothetical protein
MTIQDLVKQTKQMPLLLQRTLLSLPEAELQSFISAFEAQVKVKENAHIKAGCRPAPARTNNAREVERMMKGIGKLGC